MAFRLPLLFLFSFCLWGTTLKAQNPMAEQAVEVKANWGYSEPQGNLQAFILSGDVYIRQGEFTLFCDRGVLWTKIDTEEEESSWLPGKEGQKEAKRKKSKKKSVKNKKKKRKGTAKKKRKKNLKGKKRKKNLKGKKRKKRRNSKNKNKNKNKQKKSTKKRQKKEQEKVPLEQNPGENTYLEIYAEGNVWLIRGDEHFYADQLIFNFQENKGIILEGTTRLLYRSGSQDVPLHVRAKEIRILSRDKLFLEDAKVSTCTFGQPHYDFRAKELELTSRQDEDGFEIYGSENTFNVLDVPIFYLPSLYGATGSNFPLKKVRVGRESDFGAYLYTDWGKKIGNWGEWILELDVREKRGLATGLDIKYSDVDPWGNQYQGLVDTYYIRDEGQDFSDIPLERKDRGRVKWDHRHWLPFNIRADIEISYLSDENFLDEYFEKEAKEGKEQETIFYLRRLYDNHGFTFLTKWRLNDFKSTTEKLPELEYHLVGEPILDDEDNIPWLQDLYFSTQTSVAQLRRRISSEDDSLGLERSSWRADSDNQFNYPFQLGVLNFNPALGFRTSVYEESLEDDETIDRVSGLFRLNMSTHFYRNYQVQSSFFDIQNLQHVITPEIEYLDIFGTTTRPDELISFDEVDTVDDIQVIRFGLLNRLKTWRGEGKDRKVIEYLYFDLDLPFYPNENRDNGGDNFGNLEYRLRWNIWNNLSVHSDGEYSFHDGKFDVFNIGLLYKFNKGSVFIGDRYIRDDSSIITLNLQYEFSERWSMRLIEQYDITNTEFTEQKLVLTRYFHRFILDMEFQRDEGENTVGFQVALTTIDLDRSRKKDFARGTEPTIDYLERLSREQEEEQVYHEHYHRHGHGHEHGEKTSGIEPLRKQDPYSK